MQQTPSIVYVVRCFDPREAFGFMFDLAFFDRADAETAREAHLARGRGYYAKPVEEQSYTPDERKSNFSGPPVRWDMPPVFCGRMVSPREAADRYGGRQ
jgi:hypothetical protein